MAVVAVTKILHGEPDGSIKEFNIGDNVTGLTDDQLRSLVESGGAVETGKNRKFSAEQEVPVALTADEELTLKRDEIIEKARLGVEDDAPSKPEK